MDNEIKTEDIIKKIRAYTSPVCRRCFISYDVKCLDKLALLAADRLEGLNDHFLDTTKKMQGGAGRAIMKRAIATYGNWAQTNVAIEEMAELTKALLKTRRVPEDDHAAQQRATSNVIEEIADVEIMIDQLKIMYGESYVNAVREQKLVRLEAWLEDKQ